MNLKSHMITLRISFTKDSPKVSKEIYTKGLDRESRDMLGFLKESQYSKCTLYLQLH